MTQPAASSHNAPSIRNWGLGKISREDELNQQIEVRQATTTCALAQGNGNAHQNQSQVKQASFKNFTPANIACYGQGILVESNVYGPDGMRAVREIPSLSLPGFSRAHDIHKAGRQCGG